MIKGVYRTRVGYTGGKKKFPTYHSLGNHTEAIQVDFNPQEISFAEIVDVFWASHNPCSVVRSRQYMTAIWFHDAAQRDAINAAKETIEQRLKSKVATPTLPLDVFYPAENYQQKYRLQNSRLQSRFDEMYPEFSDYNDSTAAARLNGWLAGHGDRKMYEEERDGYGFPSEQLDQMVRV